MYVWIDLRIHVSLLCIFETGYTYQLTLSIYIALFLHEAEIRHEVYIFNR